MSGKKIAPTDIDRNIGATICLVRKTLGLSQKDVAKQLGVTFQQMQKYETAGNRIAASRLYELAQVLGVSVGTLFNEASSEYMHNKHMRKFIERVCLMSPADRRLMFTLAERLEK